MSAPVRFEVNVGEWSVSLIDGTHGPCAVATCPLDPPAFGLRMFKGRVAISLNDPSTSQIHWENPEELPGLVKVLAHVGAKKVWG